MRRAVLFARCFAAGLGLTIGLIIVGLSVKGFDRLFDALLQPFGWILEYGPGGKEDPLLLLVAIPTQAATYGVIFYACAAVILRVRHGSSNNDLSGGSKK